MTMHPTLRPLEERDYWHAPVKNSFIPYDGYSPGQGYTGRQGKSDYSSTVPLLRAMHERDEVQAEPPFRAAFPNPGPRWLDRYPHSGECGSYKVRGPERLGQFQT